MSKAMLIGSTTSPFVRRTRLWFASHNFDYDFHSIVITDENDRAFLKQYTPIMKIPVLVDGDKTIFDSEKIYHYTNQLWQKENPDYQELNLYTVIDGINDSLVTLFYAKNSGLDTSDESLMIVKMQKARLELSWQHLNEVWQNRTGWHYADISLYCLLDWVQFRGFADLSPYSNLIQFHQNCQSQAGIALTDPRQS